jgi:hypothetical protein
VCHAIYKAYWHRGDIENQIQEMVDRFDDWWNLGSSGGQE